MPFLLNPNQSNIFLKFYSQVNSTLTATKHSGSIANNETNPFRLKFFGIYEFILERIFEVFVSFVPDQVFAAFKPQNSTLFSQKALFNPLYPGKVHKSCFECKFPEGTIHKITVETVSELEIYFTTFYPKIYPFMESFI